LLSILGVGWAETIQPRLNAHTGQRDAVNVRPAPFGPLKRPSRVVHDRPPLCPVLSAHRLDRPAQQPRRKIMKTTKPERPMYRVTFSRITGKDAEGKDILARPKEIGVVWPRKQGKTGGLITLDLIPVELSQRQGVLFLVPVTEGEETKA
jgi:hypothetical protein